MEFFSGLAYIKLDATSPRTNESVFCVNFFSGTLLLEKRGEMTPLLVYCDFLSLINKVDSSLVINKHVFNSCEFVLNKPSCRSSTCLL